MEKTVFALYFGNRGFFPESLIASARRELVAAVEKLGFGALVLDEGSTRYGAVESAAEGRRYAAFLADQKGRFDGVILCLPNFGDETGAVAALRDAGVPILVQAYPDEIGKMDFSRRRDAFCGKFSIMDVFHQYGVAFTAFPPHVAHPASTLFEEQLTTFAAVCRVVKTMRRCTVGAIGARTTAFKTVRFDELCLQRYGITVEALDLTELFQRTRSVDGAGGAFKERRARLLSYSDFSAVPEEKTEILTRLSVAIDEVVRDYGMDALALRCWIEIEKEFGVSPCVLLSELNDRGVVAACELDVCNAVPMLALSRASSRPATCLDWNNNYGEEEDKCILFHCGPVPQTLMEAKGRVAEHLMFAKSLGAGCGWGCNVGRIAANPMTFASTKTEDGALSYYLGEGRFTGESIEEGFFGCGGVAEIPQLQRSLLRIGVGGFRHHVSVTAGHWAQAVKEAFDSYLGYDSFEI